MLEYIKGELREFGISDAECIPLSICKINRPYKLERAGFSDTDLLSAVIFTIPYYTEHNEKNISSYAIPRDYHLFCDMLFEKLLRTLRAHFPLNRFAGFSDSSPIDERHAAAMAGLGVMGQNGMLITEKYSSYVFLGELITDLPLEWKDDYHMEYCNGCGRCLAACPKDLVGECLSSLTQKKGELSEDERQAIKKYGCAWGCDICQEVCPHTQRAKETKTVYTDIEFFKSELLPKISAEMICDMDDRDFSCRAYSWRKKETVLRNLKLLEEK